MLHVFLAASLFCALSTISAQAQATPESALLSGPSRQPQGLAVSNAGIWVALRGSNEIGLLDDQDIFHRFLVPTPNSGPFGIAVANDGSVWFTESQADKVGHLSPDGKITEYAVPTKEAMPTSITVSNGVVWFTETEGSRIGRIGPDGVVSEILVDRQSRPSSIAADSTGNVWFSEFADSSLGEIRDGTLVGTWPVAPCCPRVNGFALTNGVATVALSSYGTIAQFVLGSHQGKVLALPTSDWPYAVAATSPSDFWYTEPFVNEVVHVVGTTAQRYAMPMFPCRPHYSTGENYSCAQMPTQIIVDAHGSAWVSEMNGNAIAEISPSGTISEHVLPPQIPAGLHSTVTAATAFETDTLRAHIKHIVFVVQENHSFDSLFAGYPGADAPTSGRLGNAIVPLMPKSIRDRFDLQHVHDAFLSDYDGGALDGFGTRDLILGPRTAAYSFEPLTETQPYWDLAKRFSLASHMFEPISGPSYAAHLYIVAGQTGGVVDLPFGQGCIADISTSAPILEEDDDEAIGPYPCFSFLTLADVMDYAGVSWRYYLTERYSFFDGLNSIASVRLGTEYGKKVVTPSSQLLADIASGRLPDFSWVMPDDHSSDHPGALSSSIGGPEWISSVVNAIGKSKYWNSTAIFIVWDDWGGYYDNVRPPSVDRDGYGFRVPFILVSPYAKRGYVSTRQHEFGSVLRFAEEDLNLLSLNQGDSRADDLLDMFDFSQKPQSFVPVGLSLQHERVFDSPAGIAYDSRTQSLYVTDLGRRDLWKVSMSGDASVVGSEAVRTNQTFDADDFLENAYDVAFDSANGSVYVADSSHDEIVTVDGPRVTTYTGHFLGRGLHDYHDGMPAVARFYYPIGLAFDSAGTMYVSDGGDDRVRRVAANGLTDTLAGEADVDEPRGLAAGNRGAVFVADFLGGRIRRIAADGSVTTFVDGLFGPTGVAFDPGSGMLYVTESGRNRVLAVPGDGKPRVLAGAGTPGSSDGTGRAASFYRPTGITFDAKDRVLFVVDSGNALIRRVTLDGRVTTLHVRCVSSPAACWDNDR